MTGTMARALRDEELESVRRRGFGVAYRMLGSVTEAEDVAQEAMLRLARLDEPIEEPAAWVTTVATRLSISVLGSARVRRETYVGTWLPEPLSGSTPTRRFATCCPRVARVMAKIAREQQRHGPFDVRLVRVNGQPGRILRKADGSIWDILSIDVVDGRIQTARVIRNPDKLAHI